MDIIKVLQEELQIGYKQAEAAVGLIDEGNTIPFIARYRKEATGSLNDEVLRNLDERLKYLRNLEEKKEQVISSIREQEKLTPELEKQILEAMTMVAVEDLYRPYRPKRRTRAMIAKEKGSLQKGWHGHTFQRKSRLPQRRRLLQEPEIFLQSESPIRQITAAISGRLPWIGE